MNVKKFFFMCCLTVIISACSPIINTQIKKSFPPNLSDPVTVYYIGEKIENQYEDLGTFKIENRDLSKISKYDEVIEFAKGEARKIGGNAIKILEHIKPKAEMYGMGVVFTTSHSVVFKVIRVTGTVDQSVEHLKDSSIIRRDANLYFYEQKNRRTKHLNRPTLAESIALNMGYGYQILLNDSLILKIPKKWQKSCVQIHKFGDFQLTAKVKHGIYNIPVKIEEGKDYYIRLKFSISGRRIFEIVDNELGEFEFSILK